MHTSRKDACHSSGSAYSVAQSTRFNVTQSIPQCIRLHEQSRRRGTPMTIGTPVSSWAKAKCSCQMPGMLRGKLNVLKYFCS